MKSIVTKLVIYKKDPRFDYCPTPYYCEGHFVGGGQFCSYCGITDTQAQEKEIENTFIGDDTMREYWTIKFNNLQEQDRKLILSAFPDIESKDKITLKDPQELYAIAFRKVLRRFAVVCPRFGYPIKILKSNYGSVENAILAQGCIRMVKTGFAPCTAYLKRRVRKEQFEVLHQNDEITYVWGFDSTKHEQTRADRIVEAMPQYNHRFPLIEQGLTKQDAHAVLRRLNIRRPAMYDLGYQNNNCVGCVKGGMGYWNKIRQDFPDVFKARAELERKLNSSCLKECFLDELAPDRGKADNEILEDCGIFCEIAARKITEAADNGGNQNHKM